MTGCLSTISSSITNDYLETNVPITLGMRTTIQPLQRRRDCTIDGTYFADTRPPLPQPTSRRYELRCYPEGKFQTLCGLNKKLSRTYRRRLINVKRDTLAG